MPLLIVLLLICFCIPAQSNSDDKIYIVSFSEPKNSSQNNNISYRSKLQNRKLQHRRLLNDLNQKTKTNQSFLFEYTHVINAISIKLNPQQASYLAQKDEVLAVTPQTFLHPATDATGSMISADQLWDGSALNLPIAIKGEDIVIGLLDTGINMNHESFTDLAQDNYDFALHNPNGAGIFLGWCNPSHPNFDISYVCNNKLLGAWDFVDVFGNESDGPQDNDIHGSWMSGVAAGNKISAPPGGFTSSFGSFVLNAPFISGIAPHAHIIMYDVCDNTIGCPTSAILAAIEQAVIDGVDVINMSLDGGLQPWQPNSVALALLNARNFGIVTATAAGNATAGQPTTLGRVNNLAPWVLTVANSLHGRTQSNDISVLAPLPIPSFLINLYAILADGITMLLDTTAKIYYSKDINNSNEEGCLAWGAADFTNAIALIKSGLCSNSLKIQNAENAGAMAVIIFNAESDIPTTMTGITASVPVLMIGLNDAVNIIAHIQLNSGNDTLINIAAETTHKLVNALGKILFVSSLRGPNNRFDITKPDITAPGSYVFAAIADLGLAAPQYLLGTGTSQSTAVTSGALALLKAHRPDWSPAEIISTLMLTAKDDILHNDTTATNTDDVGSGLLDVAAAANVVLVLDESTTNFINANPAMGGVPRNLNLASMRNNACLDSCSWSRTLTNKGSSNHTWNVSTQEDVNSEINVSQTTFTLAPNQSTTLIITFNQISGSSNENRYAKIILTDVTNITPELQMSIVVYLDHLVFSNGFE